MKITLSNILKPIAFLIVGILLCCSVIDPGAMLNWTIAICLLVFGLTFVIFSLATLRTLFSASGIAGSILLALGILFLPVLNGINISWMNVISMLMMVFGSAFILDATIKLFLKTNVTQCLVTLVLGGALLALGLCLWLIESFTNFAGLVLGVFFIIYAILDLISLITHKEIVVVKFK